MKGAITSALSGGFSSLASSIGLSTTALGGFLAVAAGITAAVVLFDTLNVSADEARDALTEMQSNYDETTVEVETLNSELETTKDRIDELNAKENLTLVEQEELATLQKTNSELERKLALKETEQRIDARKAAEQAEETYKEWTTDDIFGFVTGTNEYDTSKIKDIKDYTLKTGTYSMGGIDFEGVKDNINELIGRYEAIQEEMESVASKRDELLKSDDKQDLLQAETLDDYYNTLEKKSLEGQNYIDAYALNMDDICTAYENAVSSGTKLSEIQKEQWAQAKSFLTEYMKMYTGASDVESQINTLLSKAAFVGVKDELIKAGETSRSVLDGVIAKTPGLTEALDEAGISAQQLGDYIMAIADPDSLRIDEIKQELKDAFETDDYEINFHAGESADAVWNEFISDKSDEEIEIFYKYVNDNGIDISKYSGEDLEATFTVAVKGQENLQDVEDTFSSILSSEDVTKQVDDFQSNISSIKEALDALRSGDYDPSFITDLKQQFPSLSESLNTVGTNAKMQSDILSSECEDIEYYKNEVRSALDLKIDLSKTIFGNVNTDDRQILQWTEDNLNVYKDALMSWADDSLTWDDVKSSLENSISTVFGGSSSYEIDGQEVEIAYTPILQTKEGAKLLDAHTVSEYIYGLIDKATEDGNWSKEELLSLDVEGLEFNGRQIQGLLADIGDTAIQTGEAMHYVGKNGSIASAYSNIAEKAKEVGMSVNEFIQASEQVSQHGEYINNLKSMLNGLAVDNFVSTMKSIKTAMEGVTDPTQLAAMKSFGEDLKKQFISALDMSDVTADDLLNNFKEVTSLDNWNPTAFQNSFGKLVSEFGGTEEGRAGLITLAAAIELDPSLAYADYETLKAYVEDNKVIANIEFSQNRIEELQSQMTTLQDEATKVQDSLSLKEAKGIKPLVSDYTKLVNNSEQQVWNLKKQNAELQKQLVELDVNDSKYQEIQSQINANVSAIDQAKIAQIEWNEQASRLRYEPNEGLTAYNKAKSTRNAGDNYLDMMSGLKEAKEAYDAGLIGTDDFKEYARMISPSGATDPANFLENYGKVSEWFTEGADGVKTFLNELDSKGLAEFNEETQQWTYSIEDMAKAANQMGVSEEVMLAMFGRLEDYGFRNNYVSSVEDGVQRLSNLYSDLAKEEALLKEMESKPSEYTDEQVQSKKDLIESIKQNIDETGQSMDYVVANAGETYNTQIESAKSAIESLAEQRKNILDNNLYGENSEAVANQLEKQILGLAEENGLQLDLEYNVVGQEDVTNATNALRTLQENGKISIDLDFNKSDMSADELQQKIDELNETKATINVDDEGGQEALDEINAIINACETEKQLKLAFDKGSTVNDLLQLTDEELINTLQIDTSQVDVAKQRLQEIAEGEEIPITVKIDESQFNQLLETEKSITVDSSSIDEAQEKANTLNETSIEDKAVNVNSSSINEAQKKLDKINATNLENKTFSVISNASTTLSTLSTLDSYLSRIDGRVVSYTVNKTVTGSSVPFASGTLTPARANGTAYNVLNMKPAYANGRKVALEHDETALVNELGMKNADIKSI